MIVDDIVNEIDKFITKYKNLKTENQTLAQLKTDIKTALNSKGIINTTEDSEVVQSINNYNPTGSSSSGGLDAEYLKSVGLLPVSFSGTPTEKDLIVNKFIIQDIKNNAKFYSSDLLSDISIELDGDKVNNYFLTNTSSHEDTPAIDRNKYCITTDGYYISNFSFVEDGNYNVSFKAGNLSFNKVLNYTVESLDSMDDFLVYAVNLKSHRNVCYDSKKIESLNGIRVQNLDSEASSLVNSVSNNLDGMGGSIELLGYVYNLRTNKAYLLDTAWLSGDYINIPSEFHERLSTVIYNNKIEVLTDSYSFALLVHGRSVESFISDIDYKEGDTLAFAFYKLRDSEESHKYSVASVARYMKKSVSAISADN